MRAVIIDFETTGLLKPHSCGVEHQPRAIEVGCVVIEGGKIIHTMTSLINPTVPLEPIITKITGLTDDALANAPLFTDILPGLIEVFVGADAFIAHNAPFDQGILQWELVRAEVDDFPWPANIICTAQEYTHMFGFRPKMLQLYERVIGRPLAQTHRALEDAEALAEIVIKTGLCK